MIRRFQTSSARDWPKAIWASYWPIEARTLRDQQESAGRAVIDILGDLRGDLAGQIRPQAGDQCRRDHRAGLEQILAGGWVDAIGADGAAIDVAVEEGELVILARSDRRAPAAAPWTA